MANCHWSVYLFGCLNLTFRKVGKSANVCIANFASYLNISVNYAACPQTHMRRHTPWHWLPAPVAPSSYTFLKATSKILGGRVCSLSLFLSLPEQKNAALSLRVNDLAGPIQSKAGERDFSLWNIRGLYITKNAWKCTNWDRYSLSPAFLMIVVC